MKIPLLDLKAQYAPIRKEIEAAVSEVMESQQFILGPTVQSFEKAIADYAGTAYACGMSSGTDALLAALMSEGVGPGDEVITTPYTFFATAGCIARLQAKPVFVDIDPATYNIRPDLIEKKITKRTKAILPVHLFGQMADMNEITRLASKHGLAVIEDAAQAIGAKDKGKSAGAAGDYGCYSFFPSKNLGCFGDGGMIVTNDEARHSKLMTLRDHGANPRYYHKVIGGNFRLDAVQAAVLLVKLEYLEEWTEKRIANARLYERFFGRNEISGRIQLPQVVNGRHVFNQYVIRIPKYRNELKKFLDESEIGNAIYYPVPLHLQECFGYLKYKKGDFPESERAAAETLAMPIYPELQEIQIQYIVDRVNCFLKKKID